MIRDLRAAVVAAALAAATFAGCGSEPVEEVESERVVTVTVAPATHGDLVGVVHATGVVGPAPGAELVVVAPEAARVVEIPHAVGDPVRRGDLLVRFEIPGALAEVQRQHAEVERAQATLDQATAARTRAHELFDRGVAARREVEEGERGVADANAGLAEARAAVAAAETVAARAAVHATFDGLVAARLHNPGDLVEAAATDPVLRVVDPRHLEVVAAIALGDATRVALGAHARLVGDPEDGPVLVVKSRPAAVDTGSATVPVRLGPLPAGRPVGSPVQVDIEAEHHRGVVLVPLSAIVRDGDETAVLVAIDGKAHRQPVSLGVHDPVHVEVTGGLAAGDQVIVDGQAGLPDGAAIAVAGAKPAAEEPPR